MGQSLTNKVKTLVGLAPVAAGTSTQSFYVDTAGYDGVRFIVSFGTITAGAVTSVKLASADDASGTNPVDLLGTSVTVADTADDKAVIIDMYRPATRFIGAVISRATQNSVINLGLVELYNTKKMPVTKDASISGQEVHVSEPAGTA